MLSLNIFKYIIFFYFPVGTVTLPYSLQEPLTKALDWLHLHKNELKSGFIEPAFYAMELHKQKRIVDIANKSEISSWEEADLNSATSIGFLDLED